MKESNPNSLLQGLATDRSGGMHPDADLLTAFAEDSLRARERETVMAHLAGCAQCREVLSLTATEQPIADRDFELVAAAAAPVVAVPIDRGAVRKKRVWLPWAGAAAACLAIVSVVAVRYVQNKNQQAAIAHEGQKTVAMNAPPPAVPAPGAAVEEARRDVQALKKSEAKDKLDLATLPTQRKILPVQREPLPAQAESLQSVVVTPQRAPTQDALSSTNQAAQQEQQQVAAQESTNAIAMEQRQSQNERAQSESAMGAARVTAPAFGGTLAKGANAPLIARPRWRINEQGHVERALGSGQWTPVLTSDGTAMHVVSAVGGTVWAGGENCVLYRSQDVGLTWQLVALPQKDGATHTIVHIRFESALTGMIEAADGTIWTTVDGGGTWK